MQRDNATVTAVIAVAYNVNELSTISQWIEFFLKNIILFKSHPYVEIQFSIQRYHEYFINVYFNEVGGIEMGVNLLMNVSEAIRNLPFFD